MQSIRNTQAVTSSLETLRAALGRDKNEKHALILTHVGTIIALALVNQAPKGLGNPADWKALPAMFAGFKMKAYAEHCAAFPQYFKDNKPRSVGDWETAQDMGYETAIAAFAGCAPRTYTAEQIAERDAKRAARKAEREKQAKADAKAERETHQAEIRAAHLAGMQAAQTAAPTGEQIADLIRTGALSDADLVLIAEAMTTRPLVTAGNVTVKTSETAEA